MRSVATRPASTLVCPSCSTPLPTRLPTCPKCSHIAPVSSEESYHALLDVPESPNPFVVDARTLRRNFLQAQRVCHPDAWSGKGQKEQAIAAAQSSLLNKAYQTLLNPVQRAQYLLSKRGEATQETDQVDNHELIMDVMDAREELEDANTEAEIETVRNRNEGKFPLQTIPV
ncbi:hypothetical protein FRC03_010809 [Tulasnella sp. 419]|nr:hypothetical protein FRC03_010809 [Tulasnella sp. 419]